jgi:hypothetical protein
MNNATAKVRYRINNTMGQITVPCNATDDNEFIIGRAIALLRRQHGPIPHNGRRQFEVIDIKSNILL